MSVLRTVKKENPYTSIYNAVFTNRDISYEALGLLSYLLSKPSNWKVQVRDLIRAGKNGETQIYRILEELQIAGYVVRETGRTEDGRISCVNYAVYEEPQEVNQSLVETLTQRRESRQRKKQDSYRKRTDQPLLAKPDLEKSGLANPPHIKERAEKKERSEKKETPTLAEQGSQAPSALPGKQNGTGTSPSIDPEAAQPRVAADAAPENPTEKFNYIRWLQSPEFPEAQKLEALFPEDTPFAQNQGAARKFHSRRRSGMLTPRGVDMLVRFMGSCRPESGYLPANLDDLLAKDTLAEILIACRAAVRQVIDEIETEGGGTDTQYVMHEFMQAGPLVKPDTDMVEHLQAAKGDLLLARLYVAYTRQSPRLTEAAGIRREEIIRALQEYPAWTKVLVQYNDKLPEILGMTLAEIQELQHWHVKDKELRLSELRIYLQ